MTTKKHPRARLGLGIALAVGFGLLSACESSEQKAENHYQSGVELLEKGDVDRAMVEFRNVFRLNGRHEAARTTYARLLRERGNVREAYSQYLLLAEQYPNNLEGRKALAEMALDSGNWEEVERSGTAALALAPDDPAVQAIGVTLAYRQALQSRDQEALAKASADAAALVAAHPDLSIARRILLDGYVRKSDWEGLLASLDEAQKFEPDAADIARMRAAALYQLGRMPELETQLKAMIAANPADAELQKSLITLYMSQKRPAAAEDFLRSRIDPASADPLARQQLVSFIAQIRGRDAARTELEAIIAANPPKAALYRTMLASMDFDAGQRDSAIAALRTIIAEKPEADVLAQARLTLARMLDATGNGVGARAEVEEVLTADKANVEALKLRANWLVDDDRTGDALVALRSALEYAPRDPQVMTLMARAHERDGSRDLMGEMLSQAMIASNRAPAESLRYAAFLEQDGKHLPAEDTLVNALRLQPRNVDLLSALGRVYVAMKDWPRADQIVRTLTEIGSEQATTAANEITARRLAALNQDQELTAFLRDLSAQGTSGAGVDVALIRTSILRGDTEGALQQARALLDRQPDSSEMRFLYASVLASAGKTEESVAAFRALTTEKPQYEPAWAGLYNLLASMRDPEAASVLEAGLAANPLAPTLSWIKAGALEHGGDIEGAIGIYEALYERDSNSPIIANNLASLLATHRADPESLERAYTVARRLRGTKVAAFQDTYGWIAYRRGSYQEALDYLEPAAQGMNDPTVGYHLGMTYAALDRKDRALEVLRGVVAGADAANPPAWLAEAEAAIARLEAPAGAAPAGGSTTGN